MMNDAIRKYQQFVQEKRSLLEKIHHQKQAEEAQYRAMWRAMLREYKSRFSHQ